MTSWMPIEMPEIINKCTTNCVGYDFFNYQPWITSKCPVVFDDVDTRGN